MADAGEVRGLAARTRTRSLLPRFVIVRVHCARPASSRAWATLARDLRIAERVTFHGALPAHRLQDLCRAADVFVGPSREQPLGLVFLEAAKRGVPVMTTAVGGIAELFTDGDMPLLVPPEDAVALARAIERARGDLWPRRRLIDGAMSVDFWYSTHRSVEHTPDVYKGVLAR